MMPRMHVSLLLLVVLTCSGCLFPRNAEPDPPPPSHDEHYRTEIAEPTAELKEATKALRGIISDPADAADTAQFYVDFADVIDRDAAIIKTTGTIREGFMRAEKLMLQRTELVGKYPGFGAAKDAVLEKHLGLEDVQLSEEKRTAAVSIFRAIAWSIKNGAP